MWVLLLPPTTQQTKRNINYQSMNPDGALSALNPAVGNAHAGAHMQGRETTGANSETGRAGRAGRNGSSPPCTVDGPPDRISVRALPNRGPTPER